MAPESDSNGDDGSMYISVAIIMYGSFECLESRIELCLVLR